MTALRWLVVVLVLPGLVVLAVAFTLFDAAAHPRRTASEILDGWREVGRVLARWYMQTAYGDRGVNAMDGET